MTSPTVPSNLAERLAPDLGAALDHLAAEGLVAFPTETSWGLAASANSQGAVERLCGFKGRARSQPISVLVSSAARIELLGCAVSRPAAAWIEALWPGPLTLVLPCRADAAWLAPGILNERGGLGIRCSPHPVASALALGAEERGLGPLTATSCNESGAPAAQTRAEARAICGEAPDAPLVWGAGDDAGGEDASTVVEVIDSARVLREGAISKQRLREILDQSGIELAPGTEL